MKKWRSVAAVCLQFAGVQHTFAVLFIVHQKQVEATPQQQNIAIFMGILCNAKHLNSAFTSLSTN